MTDLPAFPSSFSFILYFFLSRLSSLSSRNNDRGSKREQSRKDRKGMNKSFLSGCAKGEEEGRKKRREGGERGFTLGGDPTTKGKGKRFPPREKEKKALPPPPPSIHPVHSGKNGWRENFLSLLPKERFIEFFRKKKEKGRESDKRFHLPIPAFRLSLSSLIRPSIHSSIYPSLLPQRTS